MEGREGTSCFDEAEFASALAFFLGFKASGLGGSGFRA